MIPRDVEFESQDFHFLNILWNHDDLRLTERAPDYKKLTRDFNFHMGIIDFGASVRFPNGCTDYSIPCRHDAGPAGVYRSPEQDQEEGKTFDLFAADVYALGQTLIHNVRHISYSRALR